MEVRKAPHAKAQCEKVSGVQHRPAKLTLRFSHPVESRRSGWLALCSCPDAKARKKRDKHPIAEAIVLQANQRRTWPVLLPAQISFKTILNIDLY